MSSMNVYLMNQSPSIVRTSWSVHIPLQQNTTACMHISADFCIFLHIPVFRLQSSAHRSVLHGTWKRTLHGMLRDVVISRSPRELHDLQGQTVKHCEASMEASGATTLSISWERMRMEMNWWETWAVTDEFHQYVMNFGYDILRCMFLNKVVTCSKVFASAPCRAGRRAVPVPSSAKANRLVLNGIWYDWYIGI